MTSDDVSRVMARHLDPARLTTLVVGDLDAIGGDLGRLGLGEPSSCRRRLLIDSVTFGVGDRVELTSPISTTTSSA